jgi:hypothetical protein
MQVAEFTRQLRQAILAGQDVSSTWKPAAQASFTRSMLQQPAEAREQQLEGSSTAGESRVLAAKLVAVHALSAPYAISRILLAGA